MMWIRTLSLGMLVSVKSQREKKLKKRTCFNNQKRFLSGSALGLGLGAGYRPLVMQVREF